MTLPTLSLAGLLSAGQATMSGSSRPRMALPEEATGSEHQATMRSTETNGDQRLAPR